MLAIILGEKKVVGLKQLMTFVKKLHYFKFTFRFIDSIVLEQYMKKPMLS